MSVSNCSSSSLIFHIVSKLSKILWYSFIDFMMKSSYSAWYTRSFILYPEPQFRYPCHVSCILIHSQSLLNVPGSSYSVHFSLFWGMLFSSFPGGSFRLIIRRLRGHKIYTKLSLRSFRKSYMLFLLLSEHLLQTAISQLEFCNSLPGLLLPYLLFLVIPYHSAHSDSFQRKIRSYQPSTQNPSLAPQLIQFWQSPTSNSLCHFSDLTSP